MTKCSTIYILLILLYSHSMYIKPSVQTKKTMSSDEWRKFAFSHIYKTRFWADEESASGPGSSLKSTTTLRLFFPIIIKALNVKSILDAGCGDLNWLKEIPLDIDTYIGIDIVPELIEKNNEIYANDWCKFYTLDLVKDPITYADLIFCRDVLQHLAYKEVKQILNNFKKSGALYLFTTTYLTIQENNIDTRSGDCRYINLQHAPFNFPEPLCAFDELSAEPDMLTWRKRMGVWRMCEIPTYNLSKNT